MSGKTKIAIAAAAVVIAASTAAVLAHGAGPGQRPVPGKTTTTVPLAASGSKAAAVGAPASRHGIALAYDETKKVSVPPGRSKIKVGPTQKKCRTINGYYFIPGADRTKIVSEGDSPAGHRFWKFYRNNRTRKTIDGVVYGTVCLRGAKLLR